MYWPISTLQYTSAVIIIASSNRMTPATRNRGRARRASNVLEGSKKMPVRVSAVDISDSLDAAVPGIVNGSLIGFLLMCFLCFFVANSVFARLPPSQAREYTRRDVRARLRATPDRCAHTLQLPAGSAFESGNLKAD